MPIDINHVHLDTRAISEPDRFEVWRSHFRRTYLDIPDPGRASLFQAQGDIITSSEGVMFTAGRCEATRNHMAGDISDFILLGSILDGESLYTHAGNDAVSVTPASGLAMLSPQDKVLISNHYHRYALIIVPKRLALARLGHDFADRGRSAFTFPRSPIGRMLDGLLRLAAQKARAFDGRAARTTLNSLVEFALAAMVEENDLQEERFPGADRAWYAATCKLIGENLGDPALDARTIARCLGISRSSLYRVLAGESETFGQLLRKIRIARAQQLLIAAPWRHLTEIAMACGYSSPAAFARAFRSGTGMTATDWRAMHAPGTAKREKHDQLRSCPGQR